MQILYGFCTSRESRTDPIRGMQVRKIKPAKYDDIEKEIGCMNTRLRSRVPIIIDNVHDIKKIQSSKYLPINYIAKAV